MRSKFLGTIFPLKLYLHILQLEGYMPLRLLSWVFSNYSMRTLGSKKPLIWTTKAKVVYYLAYFTTFLLPFLALLIFKNPLFFFLLFFLLVTQPYLQLLVAIIFIKPYEIWNKAKTIERTRRAILSLPKLQVVGITGSYGKTSVKEFLYQILKTKYKVLRTPESYNTVFGIAKVVDLELDSSYDFFISEMGAYRRGDIAELCRMVNPKYGILTGIAEQHLERFGSLENIILGKYELVESLSRDGFAALNIDNSHIKDNLKKVTVPYCGYGQDEEACVRIDKMRVSEDGSKFNLITPQGKIYLHTKLVGKSNVQNIAGAATLALHLGVPPLKISRAVANLEPVPNRLELLKRGDLTIIDDSFNSNTEGFREAVETADLIKSKFKVLVTPGIVDLGSRTHDVHKSLGKVASGVFDLVILVTDSARTRGLEDGLLSMEFDKEKIEHANTLGDAMQLLREKTKPGTLVLLENDLPDNY